MVTPPRAASELSPEGAVTSGRASGGASRPTPKPPNLLASASAASTRCPFFSSDAPTSPPVSPPTTENRRASEYKSAGPMDRIGCPVAGTNESADPADCV
eukprot:CAMPEP_0181349988 /NCGR_PEP_ID=MMETSP1106-20121128/1022_1 /TAXON_ID=81844 /ORGANISM="Mantoniella antarctica, Strain SL-175" /LENGTH=99 /DNA_ID=CAMNT_0023462423 /DNA_START=483 /DNA_END=778 /DNA_ORIENTATION=-